MSVESLDTKTREDDDRSLRRPFALRRRSIRQIKASVDLGKGREEHMSRPQPNERQRRMGGCMWCGKSACGIVNCSDKNGCSVLVVKTIGPKRTAGPRKIRPVHTVGRPPTTLGGDGGKPGHKPIKIVTDHPPTSIKNPVVEGPHGGGMNQGHGHQR